MGLYEELRKLKVRERVSLTLDKDILQDLRNIKEKNKFSSLSSLINEILFLWLKKDERVLKI